MKCLELDAPAQPMVTGGRKRRSPPTWAARREGGTSVRANARATASFSVQPKVSSAFLFHSVIHPRTIPTNAGWSSRSPAEGVLDTLEAAAKRAGDVQMGSQLVCGTADGGASSWRAHLQDTFSMTSGCLQQGLGQCAGRHRV